MIEQFVVDRTGLTKEDLLTIREKKKVTYFSDQKAREKKIITDIIHFAK